MQKIKKVGVQKKVGVKIAKKVEKSERATMILPVQKTSVKTHWKTTFKGPMFIRGSPYNTTHITTVWAYTPTVKHLSRAPCLSGVPPIIQYT